jgi:hypothetical protein
MPVTPFHFGLGAVAKSIAPKNFSFQVFLLSQILMDIQPGINLILGWRPLHGWTHTYLGAILVGLFVVFIWKIWEKLRPKQFATAIANNLSIGISSLFGTVSHVWLDSQYHQEMWRLTPNWARLLTPNQVEGFCITTIGIAGIIYAVRLLTLWLYTKKVGQKIENLNE